MFGVPALAGLCEIAKTSDIERPLKGGTPNERES
jgi:hypothetical protein